MDHSEISVAAVLSNLLKKKVAPDRNARASFHSLNGAAEKWRGCDLLKRALAAARDVAKNLNQTCERLDDYLHHYQHRRSQSPSRRSCPLYFESRGQPYSAMLYLDEDGICSLETEAPWENSVPARVWHGRTLTWSLPAEIKGYVLHDTLTSESVLELLQRVYEGHDVEWDGNNWSGTLDEDAQDAYDELERILEGDWESYDLWTVWNADEWLYEARLGDVWPAGKSLQEAVEHVVRDAAHNDVFCGTKGDVESALLDKLREQISDDEDFEPTPEQLAALDD